MGISYLERLRNLLNCFNCLTFSTLEFTYPLIIFFMFLLIAVLFIDLNFPIMKLQVPPYSYSVAFQIIPQIHHYSEIL